MIYSAIVSCFDESGRPDREANLAAVEHNIVHSGVDGLFVNGSTGENQNMPTEYKKEILKTVAEANHGRVRAIAHIGTNVIEEFDELAACAADCGYDAVCSVAPIYFSYDQEDYVRFFHTLADRSPLPVYFYNIPVRTHVNLTRDSFRKIFSHPNMKGVKFTDYNLSLFQQVRNDNPHIDLLSGFDDLLLAYTAMGADGSIGTGYNLTGKLARRVFDLTREGKLSEARVEQAHLNEILELMWKHMTQVVKATMELYGVPCGPCRFPQPATTAEDRSTANKVYGLVERYL